MDRKVCNLIKTTILIITEFFYFNVIKGKKNNIANFKKLLILFKW